MPVFKNEDNGTWYVMARYVNWKCERKQKCKRGFATKKEAQEWERMFQLQTSSDLDMSFEAFTELYINDVKNRLKENTWLTKEHIIRTKILPFFGKLKISEISTKEIITWQNEMLAYRDDKKKPYSQTYLKTLDNQLSAIFNYAVRYYDLKDNPCRKAGSIGKSHAGEKEFWTRQEFKQFLVTVENKPETKMAFLLLYRTGMRIGELLAITYNDIDLEKRTISINKSYQRIEGRDIITPPKTPKSKRIITIPPFLTEELKEYISHLYGIMADERMFRFTKSYMEHEIIRGTKASGVKRICLHDIRHSHVALLISMEVNPLIIKDRLGHEKIQTTLGTYGHLYPNSNFEVAKMLGGVINFTPATESVADYTHNQFTASYHRKYKNAMIMQSRGTGAGKARK